MTHSFIKENHVGGFLELVCCNFIYYMAVSHKDWELPNSRIDWLKSTLKAVQIFPCRLASRPARAVKKFQTKMQILTVFF